MLLCQRPHLGRSLGVVFAKLDKNNITKAQSSVLFLSPPSSLPWWIFWCHLTSILCSFEWTIQGQNNLSCSASNTWHHPSTPPTLSPPVGIVSLCTRPWGRNIHNRMPISPFLSHNLVGNRPHATRATKQGASDYTEQSSSRTSLFPTNVTLPLLPNLIYAPTKQFT